MLLADVASSIINATILAGSALLKLPQIAKIVRARSVLGISEFWAVFECVGYGATCLYNIISGHPFAAWGEAANIFAQNSVIVILYWRFCAEVQLPARLSAVAVCVAFSVYLLAVDAPPAVVTVVGLVPSISMVASRLPQMFLNFRQGHTGQLAASTFVLQLAGSLARIFTTIHLMSGDHIVLLQQGASAVLNAAIILQIWRYRRVTRSIATEARPMKFASVQLEKVAIQP
eukprot:TRINITY_DN7975_c0_g1_i1.p1 TRINITY_DN7975_c0_g1~~TRINITY_DN7975_c0_g1_i1.p1  ORF type:complete len:231 (+),score=36.74 TRINITY_DN7975_c0_g1_i1:80-772(+)